MEIYNVEPPQLAKMPEEPSPEKVAIPSQGSSDISPLRHLTSVVDFHAEGGVHTLPAPEVIEEYKEPILRLPKMKAVAKKIRPKIYKCEINTSGVVSNDDGHKQFLGYMDAEQTPSASVSAEKEPSVSISAEPLNSKPVSSNFL